jgi:hypothetical protein
MLAVVPTGRFVRSATMHDARGRIGHRISPHHHKLQANKMIAGWRREWDLPPHFCLRALARRDRGFAHPTRPQDFSTLAERVGFEPPVDFRRTLVFKTRAINHSATSPRTTGTEQACSTVSGSIARSAARHNIYSEVADRMIENSQANLET